MKILIIALFIFVNTISAQQEQKDTDVKITGVTIGSGESSLSTGIFGSMGIETGNNYKLIFEVNQSYMQFMYGKTVGDLYIAGSGGYFSNTPWVGPYITYSPTDWISFLTWEGWCAGTDSHPSAKEINFYFAFNSVKVSSGIFYMQYALLHFQKDTPNNLPGIGVAIPIGKYTFSIGGDYSLRDKKPLFSGAFTLKF